STAVARTRSKLSAAWSRNTWATEYSRISVAQQNDAERAILAGLAILKAVTSLKIPGKRPFETGVAFAAYWMNSNLLAACKCRGWSGKDATTCWQENRACPMVSP